MRMTYAFLNTSTHPEWTDRVDMFQSMLPDVDLDLYNNLHDGQSQRLRRATVEPFYADRTCTPDPRATMKRWPSLFGSGRIGRHSVCPACALALN